MNDFYIKGIEEINLNDKKIKNIIIKYLLKTIILIKDFLSKINFAKYSLISIVLFKEIPQKNTAKNLRKYNWKIKTLPKNPYK